MFEDDGVDDVVDGVDDVVVAEVAVVAAVLKKNVKSLQAIAYPTRFPRFSQTQIKLTCCCCCCCCW